MRTSVGYAPSALTHPTAHRSIPGHEEMPSAVGPDAEAVEIVGAEVEHVAVVGAGDDLEQLDLLLRGQLLERHAREIGPQKDFLRRAGVDMDEARVEDVDHGGEDFDALRIGIIRFPIG